MPKCSEKLKRLRLDAGWSQNRLAREAGIDPGTVSSAERGAEVLELSLVRILKALSTNAGREIDIAEVLAPLNELQKRRRT